MKLKKILSVVAAMAVVASMSTMSIFAKEGELTGTTENVMTNADGSVETFTADYDTFAGKVSADYITAGQVQDKDGNVTLKIEISSDKVVTPEAVEAAVKAAKTIGTKDNADAKAALEKIFEEKKAADEKFEGIYSAFSFDTVADLGMNVKVTVKTDLADGTYYLYDYADSKLVDSGEVKVAAGLATLELTKTSNYYATNVKLDLAAGEGQDESEEVITTTEAPAEVTTTEAEATSATEATSNPTTGNAPIALALIPVAIAAAAIVAKKAK